MSAQILIVDDDALMREELADSLRHEGYLVEIASGGREAVKKLDRNHFVLMLLDLKMPEVSGFDVLKHIREKGKKIKVIVISGMPLSGSLMDMEHFSDGADSRNLLKIADYVTGKPFDFDKLLTQIKKFVPR